MQDTRHTCGVLATPLRWVPARPPQSIVRGHTLKFCPEIHLCAHLKAVNMQNHAKFKNAEITGVVAVICARHGLFQPGAVVDLQQGEK
jgi:Kyakuja-Dileera-Zisupton transposase